MRCASSSVSVFTHERAVFMATRQPNPLRAVFSGFVGSIVTVGAGLCAVAGASTAASRALVARARARRNVKCPSCSGKKLVPCMTCKGKRAIEWQPIQAPTVDRLCLCPTCKGTALQKCTNCLGVGLV